MQNPRTDSARAHDDCEVIDAATDAPLFNSSAGGNLQRDLATLAELEAVDDPEGSHRVTKQNAIDNDQACPADRQRGN